MIIPLYFVRKSFRASGSCWGEGAELIFLLRKLFCTALWLSRWWLSVSRSSQLFWWRAPSSGRKKSLHLGLRFFYCKWEENVYEIRTVKLKCFLFICFQDINVCILENYPECSNPRVFYIIPYFCGQHPQCRYVHTPTQVAPKTFWCVRHW